MGRAPSKLHSADVRSRYKVYDETEVESVKNLPRRRRERKRESETNFYYHLTDKQCQLHGGGG